MSQLTLPLLAVLSACDPKDASDCDDGFVRAEDGNCYPIVVDSGDMGGDADADADTDADADADADTDIEPPPPPRAIWGETELVLVVPDGLAAVAWGMAQTDCGKGDCWTGEDCVYGDTFGKAKVQYCHPIGGKAEVVLSYRADPEALTEGAETFFPGPRSQEQVTHYVALADGGCLVWGHDPSYYAAVGCIEL